VLKNGDLLKIDAGITYQKGIADAAVSICVGGPTTNTKGQKLINITHTALEEGIKIIKP
jgi:methionine aminopeptidase